MSSLLGLRLYHKRPTGEQNIIIKALRHTVGNIQIH